MSLKEYLDAHERGLVILPSPPPRTSSAAEVLKFLGVSVKKAYVVKVGINYRDRRAEPGDVVTDLKPGEIEWMLADNVIEEAPSGTDA